MTTYYINKTSTLTRGLLVTQITKKNFALTLVSAQKTEAVTLMSTDVEQICDLIIQLHEFATAIPAVACCIYFIYRMVGVAFVLTFAIALGKLPSCYKGTCAHIFPSWLSCSCVDDQACGKGSETMGRRNSGTRRTNEHRFAAIERHQDAWSAIYNYGIHAAQP